MKYSKVPDKNVYIRWLIMIVTVCIYPEDTFSDVAAQIPVIAIINNVVSWVNQWSVMKDIQW